MGNKEKVLTKNTVENEYNDIVGEEEEEDVNVKNNKPKRLLRTKVENNKSISPPKNEEVDNKPKRLLRTKVQNAKEEKSCEIKQPNRLLRTKVDTTPQKSEEPKEALKTKNQIANYFTSMSYIKPLTQEQTDFLKGKSTNINEDDDIEIEEEY